MDEPAKHVVPSEREGAWRLGRIPARRGPKVEAMLRALGVVVGKVLTKDRFEVVSAEHEHPVGAFTGREASAKSPTRFRAAWVTKRSSGCSVTPRR